MKTGEKALNYTSLFNNFKQSMRSNRIKKGLTQAELAKKLNISKRTIINYESGSTLPTPETMESISIILEIPLEDMISDNPEIQQRIKLLAHIEEMEKNPNYQELIEEKALITSIRKKSEFLNKVNTKEITNTELDDLLQGSLNIPQEKKIELIILSLDSQIKSNLELLEKFYTENWDNLNQAIKFTW